MIASLSSLSLPTDRRTRLALVALVTLLLVLLIWWLVSQHGSDDDGEVSGPPGPDLTAKDAGGDALIVPSIRLDAPLVPIAMHGNTLTPPSDTDLVGWWRLSAEPGARRGQTLVTGHTVRDGGGVMGRLAEVERGDRVRIVDEGEIIAYRATKVFIYSKAELAENAQSLFGQHRRDGRLVLVSCTDWDGEDYLSNVIVFARQVGQSA